MLILYPKYLIPIFQLYLSKRLHHNLLTFDKDTNPIIRYMAGLALDFTALMDDLFILIGSIKEGLAI
jgi:hypothetical protein